MTKPRARRTGIIGCNIKPGHTPGGMTPQIRTVRRAVGSEKIKAAADAVLVAHGVTPVPSAFERMVGMPPAP